MGMKSPESPAMADQNPHEIAALAAELGKAPELDLHEMTIDEALSALDHFINRCFLQGDDAVKIIHGRGTGKLKEAVMKYLQQQPELIAYARGSNAPGQQGGVTIAVLHSPHRA